MSRRLASLLLALPLASALAACGATPPAPNASPSAAPAGPVSTPPATPTVAPATATPNTGNVDGPGAPDFSVEPVGAQTIRITLVAPDAKAWRISVAGLGAAASDRWDLMVETGDVAPVITTTETRNGVSAEPTEQPKLETGAASGRVCSATLPVCVLANSLKLPADGNATIVLELARTDVTAPLSVTAATAGWDGDPFVLGAWTVTDAFPWGA